MAVEKVFHALFPLQEYRWLTAPPALSKENRMTTLQEIIAAAKTLSAADRLQFVDAVWDEAAPESWPRPSSAWIEEVQQRSAEYDAGRMPATSWPGVKAQARREAGLDG